MTDDEADKPEMHPVEPEEKRLLNRHERRGMIKQSLSRDKRLLIQELKRDLVKALVKPKNMTKAQLRRCRKKDAAR